jgi:hypothetical protein
MAVDRAAAPENAAQRHVVPDRHRDRRDRPKAVELVGAVQLRLGPGQEPALAPDVGVYGTGRDRHDAAAPRGNWAVRRREASDLSLSMSSSWRGD